MHFIVELIDDEDDLIGYGVCFVDGTTYRLFPDVHSTRSTAHDFIRTHLGG